MEGFKSITIIFLFLFSFTLLEAKKRAAIDSQPFLKKMQRESAAKLKRFGEIVTAHADDNKGKFYSQMSE